MLFSIDVFNSSCHHLCRDIRRMVRPRRFRLALKAIGHHGRTMGIVEKPEENQNL